MAALGGVAVVALGATGTNVASAAEQKPTTTASLRISLPPDIAQAVATLSPGPGFVPIAAYQVGLFPGATGTQTYTCQADSTWPAKSTPEANLAKVVGAGPRRIHHYAGPRWSEPLPNGTNGSTVLGAVDKSVANPGSIPWLLLDVTAHEGPAGAMDRVERINRVLTTQGVPPAGACQPGATVTVPYGAVYVFWAAA
jgi:hypothetical protein